MGKIKELYTKYKEIINYLIFGVLTTLVNIVVYAILAKLLKINYMASNIVAIITSILFAYVTNKLYVFESKNDTFKEILKELISFFACRGVTALMDIGLMFLTVSIMHLNDILMKITVNILVILLNYIFSKLIVFKSNKNNKKNKSQNIIYLIINIFFKILFSIISIIMGVVSLFFSAYFKSNYTDWDIITFNLKTEVEKIFYKMDNMFITLIVIMIIVLIIYILNKIIEKLKINNKTFVLIMIVTIFILLNILIYSLQIYPKADQVMCYNAAYDSIKGKYEMFNKNSYLGYFPYQIGIVFYFEMIFRLFKTTNFLVIQFLNTIELSVMFYYMYLTINKILKNYKAERISIILMFMFIPIYPYVFFVYGNIPGLMFATISIYYMLKYFENNKNINLLLSGLTIAIAINLKNNYLIYFIAESIIYFIYSIKNKDYKLLFMIIITFILNKGISKIPEKYYEIKGNLNISEGISKNAWIAMGMQESNLAPGWYNGYPVSTYLNSKCDKKIVENKANKEIKKSITEFIKNPNYTLDFYSKKIISQWCEPTFESRWILQPWVNKNFYLVVEKSRLLISFFRGNLRKIYDLYCESILIIIYIGTSISIIKNIKKLELKNDIFLIIFLGGFAFHILWEGKSQYIWNYIFGIIPYIGLILDKNENKLLKSPKK